MKIKHTFTGFDGHIILYCKLHYKCSKEFIEGLRIIWSIRCGYDYIPNDKSVDESIANKLYDLLTVISPNKIKHLQETIHNEIGNNFRYEDCTALETLIYIYVGKISTKLIKEKVGKYYHTIIQLPKPKKRLFNRILKGKGTYKDYYLIESK